MALFFPHLYVVDALPRRDQAAAWLILIIYFKKKSPVTQITAGDVKLGKKLSFWIQNKLSH